MFISWMLLQNTHDVLIVSTHSSSRRDMLW
jgi:hypothetical protein